MSPNIKTSNSKKKSKKNIPIGVAHIQSTFNNTIVTISDLNGNTVSWASAGSSGFKGARKGTPFAAQTAAEKAAQTALDLGVKKVEVLIKGQGSGRETAIRALQVTVLKFYQLKILHQFRIMVVVLLNVDVFNM